MLACGLCRYRQRRALGLLGVRHLDETVGRHLVDHPVTPLDGALALAERMIIVRRLRQRREIGRIGDGQFIDGFVEIDERGGGNAVGAEAQINLVQVKLEDLILRVGALDLQRQQRLLDLAREGKLVRQQEVLGDLLRNG